MKIFDWNFLTADDKNLLKKQTVFLWASRWMSQERILKIQENLHDKNLIWGIAKEDYILGLEESIQFKTLKEENLINEDKFPKITFLKYYQRDLKYIIKDLKPKLSILVNGSWHRAIHQNETFWELVKTNLTYKFISPFVNTSEALKYLDEIRNEYLKQPIFKSNTVLNEKQIFQAIEKEAKKSFDWNYQVASALVSDCQIECMAHNEVLPYESFSAHKGSMREKNFSPMLDQNNYDSIHAETNLICKALAEKNTFEGKTLYVNLFPCINCSMILSKSKLKEIVYLKGESIDRSLEILNQNKIIVRKYIDATS